MNQKQILLKSLKANGFSKKILNAFEKVERENFVPDKMRKHAYENSPLPIGKGQTISQPFTIAMMFSLLELKKGQKVLEVGSGCGYALALLSEIVGEKGEVHGVEIIKELVEKSKQNLKKYQNVKVHYGNGRLGIKEKTSISHEQKLKGGVDKGNLGSLYDVILISARTREIPKQLVNQLKENGIIVAPIGNIFEQSLTAFKKIKGKIKIKKEIPGFMFVPLVEG
jgi:protein-L-isoaspartate(D-aspartate) O-methyltransferase